MRSAVDDCCLIWNCCAIAAMYESCARVPRMRSLHRSLAFDARQNIAASATAMVLLFVVVAVVVIVAVDVIVIILV